MQWLEQLAHTTQEVSKTNLVPRKPLPGPLIQLIGEVEVVFEERGAWMQPEGQRLKHPIHHREDAAGHEKKTNYQPE